MDKDDTGTAGEHTRRINSSGGVDYLCGGIVVASSIYAYIHMFTDGCPHCGHPFDSRQIKSAISPL